MDVLARLINLVVPSTCAGCGLPGDLLCATCRAALRPGEGVPCATCAHPWPVAVRSCPECPPRVAVVRSLCRYDSTARAVISALKDDGRPALAPILGEMMARVISAPPPGTLLIPVPLTPRRQRQRGFNQAALLAHELAGRWGRHARPLIRRVRETGVQRGASRTTRIRQVRRAFEMASSTRPTTAVLVDDVLTTGATLTACARVLHHAGTQAVGAVVVARVERVGMPEYAAELSDKGVEVVRDR